MASAEKKKLPLQERVPLRRTGWRLVDLAVLALLLALVTSRAAALMLSGASPPRCWFVELACEAWFTLVWLLNVNGKWSPVRFDTFPERLISDELPAVDMFVTTADPSLEPPLVTVNTVLSLLAVEYPPRKLACYVSDDGCSPLTLYALREALVFARRWVPFCKRHSVEIRAPFVYFSSTGGPADAGDEWVSMKNEYEELVSRIENAAEDSLVQRGGEFAEFSGAERRNHPTIIKVLWDNSSSKADDQVLMPSLVYIAREKRPDYHHHFKAGAMNVLTRVSGVLTNAPIMLNVDCDMFANNPRVVLHAMCLLLGFDDEVHSGFVQAPQKFYGDPLGIEQMEVSFQTLGWGIAGIQGMFYSGTGCFHRRKVIYGVPPHSISDGSPPSYSSNELQRKLGSSKELVESARSIISGDMLAAPTLPSRLEAVKDVSACNYEAGTCWGQEVGWVYGSMTEDILTGQRIHAAGWSSALLNPNLPAFLGSAPTGGPASLAQYKRWATGLFEILISRNNPVLLWTFKRLKFRQCLAYLIMDVWPVRAVFELVYALLGPYCLLANQSFLPKASEPGFGIHLALFLTYNAYTIMEYMDCGFSARAWWNNHQVQRITSASAWLLAFHTVVLKTLGLSQTVFTVTRKQAPSTSHGAAEEEDHFTFDSSLVFVPSTALATVNLVAIAVGAWRVVVGGAVDGGGPGFGEFVCCGWLLMCFWSFVRGLVSKGANGIPWSVKLKAALLVAAFVYFCTRV